MDIDEVDEVEMAVTPVPTEDASWPHRQLMSLFTPFPFTPEVCEVILARRDFMSNELIIDLLLEQAAIPSPQSLYPPDSEDALKHLLAAINESPWDTTKRSALHYYLLCFVSTQAAQHATGLPPHFAALAQSCFLLDAGDFPSLQRAVSLLSDGRIVQDLAPKVLQTLELAKEPSLVRTYVRTAQPVLQSFEEAAIYLRALLSQSLADAWTFQRGFAEGCVVRNQLMRVILDACFIPPNPTHLSHLLSLPLTAFESALLQSYALSPPSELSAAANAALQDLLTVRLLSSGKYSEAIRISQAFNETDKITRAEKGAGADTEPLAREAAARRTTMRAVLNVLPAVQRRDLEGELGNLGDVVQKLNGVPLPRTGREPDSLTSSWEDLALSTSRRMNLGSPAPGRVTSATDIPGGKAGMGISISGTPMSVASPMRKHIPSKATPPVRPPATTATTPTATLTRPVDMLIPKPIPPTPGLLPKPTVAIIPSTTPSQHSATLTASPGGRSTTQQFALPLPSRPGRFGLQPTPTPPPPSFGSPSPQKLPAKTASELFTSTSIRKEKTPTSLFGRPVTPPRSRTASPNSKGAEPPSEDIVMVDSDDPDAFVVHGRGRNRPSLPPVSSPPRPSDDYEKEEEHHAEESKRADEQATTNSKHRTLPGGFPSYELREEEPSPVEEAPKRGKVPQTRRSTRRSVSAEPSSEPPSQAATGRVKIPGALYEEDEEEQEEADSVPSLPSPRRTTRQRTRGGRQSSASVESDDGEGTPKLRRSSRISSLDQQSPQKKGGKEGKSGGKRKRKAP